MTRKIVGLVLLLSSFLFQLNAQEIPPAPSPMKFVNDYANVLTPQEIQSLEYKLNRYNDSTSNQIVIVTLPSLGQYDISQVSYKIASTWGIGQKGKNNGVLILVSLGDRKSRIEVGYGLEGVLTDIQTKHIQDDYIKPNFKEARYAAGLDQSTSVIMNMIAGTYKRDGTETDKNKDSGGGFWTVLLVLGFIVFVIYLASKGGNRGGGTTFFSGGYYYGGGGSSYSGDSGSSFDFGGGGFGGGGSSGDW